MIVIAYILFSHLSLCKPEKVLILLDFYVHFVTISVKPLKSTEQCSSALCGPVQGGRSKRTLTVSITLNVS